MLDQGFKIAALQLPGPGLKTQSSARTIGLSALAAPHLPTVKDGEFVFGGTKPLTYTQVRKMCERIKWDTGFTENITPIRFRTTVLTDLYDQAKDIKLAQAAAGHTTSAMTLRYYVKGRETISKAAAVVDRAYSGQPRQLQEIRKAPSPEPVAAQRFDDP